MHVPSSSQETLCDAADLDARGRRLADETARAVDELLTLQAAAVLNAVAVSRRVSPHHLALAVPGLCHAHGPDDRAAVPGCAYCARRGNCFGPAGRR